MLLLYLSVRFQERRILLVFQKFCRSENFSTNHGISTVLLLSQRRAKPSYYNNRRSMPRDII